MDELINKPQRTEDELRKALEHVTRQLLEVELEKKEFNKNYNERIKDLKEEIDGIIEQLGE